jgi:hypothetical protein
MSKRRAPFVAVLVAVSTAYDFYRGYHQDQSVLSGVVYSACGLIVLALFWWLYSTWQSLD